MDKSNISDNADYKVLLDSLTTQFSIHDDIDKKRVENILCLDRDPEWATRILILKWWFDSDLANNISFKEFTENACQFNDKDSIVSRFLNPLLTLSQTDRFNIPDKNGLMKGSKNLRNQISELKILFQQDGKNYYLTDLGKKIANYLYFCLIKESIGINGIINLLKSDLNIEYIKNCDLDPESLRKMYLIEISNEKKSVSNKKIELSKNFRDLLKFLQFNPYLYGKNEILIIKNLNRLITLTLVEELDFQKVILTENINELDNFKDSNKKVSWIYKLNLKTGSHKYALNQLLKESIAENLSDKCILIESPAGYGKTIFIYQNCIDYLNENDNLISNSLDNKKELKKIIFPFIYEMKNFIIKKIGNTRVFSLIYNDIHICQFEDTGYNINLTLNEDNDPLLLVLIAFLKPYKLLKENLLKIYFGVLMKCRFLLIFDAWDEANPRIKLIILELMKYFNKMSLNLKILITTRFLDSSLHPLVILKESSTSKNEKEYQNVYQLELPNQDQIKKYLRAAKKGRFSESMVNRFLENFDRNVRPLDLYLIGIFPNMNFPEYKTQLYERWFYFQVLSRYLEFDVLEKIENEDELLFQSRQFEITRKVDKQSFNLYNLLNGNIPSVHPEDKNNYALFSIIPQICYSNIIPEKYPRLDYQRVLIQNPLLSLFIGPKYDEKLWEYASIADWHFFDFFIGKYIYDKFLNNESVYPLYHKDVEAILKEMFKLSIDRGFIREFPLGIQKAEQFISHLYLEAKMKFPALVFLEDHFDDGGGDKYDSGMVVTWEVESPEFGDYLLKTFQFEYNRGKNNKNLKRVQKILELFPQFYENRPSIQRQVKMTIDGDPDVYEPEINHKPLEYFHIIIDLFGIEIHPDRIELIEFTGKNDIYYMKNLFIGYNSRKYYRKDDLAHAIEHISQSDNLNIFVWLSKIILSTKDELYIKFNSTILEENLLKTKDQAIQVAIFEILSSIHEEKIENNYENILHLNNPRILELLSNRFIEKTLRNDKLKFQKISNKDFTTFLKLILHEKILKKDRVKIITESIHVQFTYEQLKYINKIESSISEKDKYGRNEAEKSRFKNKEKYRIFFQDEEDFELEQKSKFLLHCILLLNKYYNQKFDFETDNYNENKKSDDPHGYYEPILHLDFMYKYSITRKNFIYFDLLFALGFTQNNILSKYWRLDISDLSKMDFLNHDFELHENEVNINLNFNHNHLLDTHPDDIHIQNHSKILLQNMQQKVWNNLFGDYDYYKNAYEFIQGFFNKYQNLGFRYEFGKFFDKFLQKVIDKNKTGEIEKKSKISYGEKFMFDDFQSNLFDYILEMIKLEIEEKELKEKGKIHYDRINFQEILSVFCKKFKNIKEETRKAWIIRLLNEKIEFSIYSILLYRKIDDSSLDELIKEKIRKGKMKDEI